MSTPNLVIELQYLPSTAYFAHILKADKVLIEAHENYQKQSHRNRCYILTANKIDLLTIPVLNAKGEKSPIQEVQIEYIQKWQNRHWRAIESAYKQAPFFEHYADYFKNEIYANEHSLFQLNWRLLKTCLMILGIKTEITLTNTYEKEYEKSLFSDLRGEISYKSPHFQDFKPYYQVFGDKFHENLSIIDLIFSEGPNSTSFLKN